LGLVARLALFALGCLLAILAGYLPSPEACGALLRDLGYYFMILNEGAWVIAVVRAHGPQVKELFVEHIPILLIASLIITTLLLLCPPRFRLLADEPNLVGVSMMMHRDRIAAIPTQTTFDSHGHLHYATEVDKRPLLFSFLVSLAHTISGYRVENAFAVNAVAGAAVLVALFLLVKTFLGREAGLVGLLLGACFPVFTTTATSGSFEVLNLLFVVLSLLTFHSFLHHHTAQHAELFLLTLIMLMQCRYESAVFVILVVFAIRRLTRVEVLSRLSLLMLLTPFLLLPRVWQMRFFAGKPMEVVKFFEFDSVPSVLSAFTIDNLRHNFLPNFFAVSGVERSWGFSLVIFAMAVVGVFLAGTRLFRSSSKSAMDDKVWALASGSAFIVTGLLVTAYRWGDMTYEWATRMGLALIPALVLAATYTVFRVGIQNTGKWTRLAVVAACFAHFAYSWRPIVEEAQYWDGTPVHQDEISLWMLRSLGTRAERTLVIAGAPNLLVIYGYPAISFAEANRSPEQLALARHFVDEVVAIQRVHLWPSLSADDRLDSRYTLKPLRMYPTFFMFRGLRMSRVEMAEPPECTIRP
jgi:hypothetical protein